MMLMMKSMFVKILDVSKLASQERWGQVLYPVTGVRNCLKSTVEISFTGLDTNVNQGWLRIALPVLIW